MSRTATIAFVATLGLALPAGWYALEAEPDLDGAPERPPSATLDVGGAHIQLSADQARVPVGGVVHVRLVAISERPRETDLRISLLERQGSPMSRVETPPREVEARNLHIASAPGRDGTVDLSFTLAGGRLASADPVGAAGQARQYTLVVSPGVAPAKRRAAGRSAAVAVSAYLPEAFALRIEPPATPLSAGGTVDVRVRVKNVSPKTLRGVTVGLSGDELTTVSEAPEIDALAPGAETTVRFRATVAKAPPAGGLSLQAYGNARYGGSTFARATVAPSGKLLAQLSGPAAGFGFAF